MSEPKWRVDGIRGFDKIIRVDGKLYSLEKTTEAGSYAGLPEARRQAERYAGKTGKVSKITNTYMYAVYLPYSGTQRPIKRSLLALPKLPIYRRKNV